MANTRSTDSEPGRPAGRYQFQFGWESPYGNAVSLMSRLTTAPGLVIDIGCGFGSVAEPLVEAGYVYAGLDVDRDALADLSARGHETHSIDLRDLDGLADTLMRIAGDRRVAGILVLDVLEHLAETRPFLRALRVAMDELGRPLLVMSVPNVAHADISAKLSFGMWDRTPTGLLDDTHLQFFTAEHLKRVTSESGLLEIDEDDFPLVLSDQHFPAQHPALAAGSPVAQLLRTWRAAADAHGQTNQFVRAYLSHDVDATGTPAGAAPMVPRFLSVVMRTQGRRAANLREALTCLAAQTDTNFDVHLMFHSDDAADLATVRAIAGEFEPGFAARVAVVPVTGGGRARPLNEALARAGGDYVAFLDDDDLVTANWVQAFAEAAGEGLIVRSNCVIRRVSSLSSGIAPYQLESGLEACFEPKFDLTRHLWNNQTPICSFAVPRKLLNAFGLRFDDSLAVLEDWEFLTRCVTLAAVRDTGEVTSIYHRWTNSESSATLHDSDLWLAVHELVLHRLDQDPMIFPRGAASSVADVWRTLDRTRAELHAARVELIDVREEIAQVAGARDYWRARVDAIVRTKRWRILGPPARAIAALRSLGRKRPTDA